jgi:hypothetical protein
MTSPEIHVHVHVDGGNVTELKEILVATKEEVLANLTTLGDTLTEIGSDVARIATALEEAVANGDLTAVAAKAAELQSVATAIEAALDEASPDPDDVPEVPEVP